MDGRIERALMLYEIVALSALAFDSKAGYTWNSNQCDVR